MNGEFSLEWYLADSKTKFRSWLRDGIPSVQESGAVLSDLSLKASGLVLTHKAEHHTLRATVGRAIVKLGRGQPFATGFPFVSLAPGIGYYQVDASLPGPGLPTTQTVTNTTLAVGGEIDLPAGFRVVGEVNHNIVPESDLAPQGTRAYGALLKHAGRWTPYVTYAFMRSAARSRSLYAKVNDNTVPAFIPGAAQINASQRAGADNIIAFDQSSWAVGTSYSFSATSKVKAEYMRTHVGDVSVLVDAPSGSSIRNQSINVLSLSYSFVF